MRYCINKETGEVHNVDARKSCLPTTNSLDLGAFMNGVSAVIHAKDVGYKKQILTKYVIKKHIENKIRER